MESKAQTLYPSKSSGRPSKIAIIGAGAVGTAVAYACAMRGDARSIVLQDINKPKVEAEALDIAHGIQFTPCGSVEGSDDAGGTTTPRQPPATSPQRAHRTNPGEEPQPLYEPRPTHPPHTAGQDATRRANTGGDTILWWSQHRGNAQQHSEPGS